MTPQTHPLRFALAVAAALLTLTSCADGIAADDMWARPTAPGAESAAFYGVIKNDSGGETTLSEYYSPACGRLELHHTEMTDGVMEMRPADPAAVVMGDGDSLTLEPMGLHLMCLELVEPLVDGETITLEMTFEGVEVMQVDVTIEDR